MPHISHTVKQTASDLSRTNGPRGIGHRLVFVAAVRYCLFDVGSELLVDLSGVFSGVSLDELHAFSQEAAKQLIVGNKPANEVLDHALDLARGPWGAFIAIQERPSCEVFTAYLPARNPHKDNEIQFGDWPSEFTIKGDFLVSLFQKTEETGKRLDVGTYEAKGSTR